MEKGKKSILKPANLIILLLTLLVIINIIFIIKIYYTKSNKGRKSSVIETLDTKQFDEMKYSDVFNWPCPDMEMFSIQGQKIRLSNLAGDVIVLRFTKFHLSDLPYLLYLEHLYKKFKDKGIHLFFIYLLGKGYTGSINEPITFSVPIIEDDGYISSLFQPRLNETIIIGRDFRIKFKNNQAENKLIYSQIMRYLLENFPAPSPLPDQQLTSLIEDIYFRNVEDGKIQNLGEMLNEKTVFINLFVSTCLGCPEHQRIRLMKEVFSQIKNDDAYIILLFGVGNNFNLIKNFSIKNALLKNLIVGIIQKSESLSEKDYYQIFRLDVDPCLFIYKNKKMIFSETSQNKKEINFDFLMKNIS